MSFLKKKKKRERNKTRNIYSAMLEQQFARREGAASIISRLVPSLTHAIHKGSCGRIGVIGGSEDYTGAPFLAAMGALRTGADLAFVVSPPAAAQAIKSYSPDIIVRPMLTVQRVPEIAEMVQSRAHACVVGPGLGTEGDAGSIATNLVRLLAEDTKSPVRVVLDACAITALCGALQHCAINPEDGEAFRRTFPYFLGPRFVITPNAVEFERLCTAVLRAPRPSLAADDSAMAADARRIASILGCTVVRKGAADIIAAPTTGDNAEEYCSAFLIQSEELGSCRRAAGQGDVFCGVLATFLAWGTMQSPPVAAKECAFAASYFMKRTAKLTEQVVGPTFLASDMLDHLGHARNTLA